MDMYHLNQIPSEAQIKKRLRRIIFGKNVFCPECNSRQVVRYEQRYRCRACRIKFSLLSHTWLSDMKALVPDTLDTPVGMDDTNTDQTNTVAHQTLRRLCKAMVWPFPCSPARRKPYFRAYCTNGRGILQRCRSSHGKAKGNEKTLI